MDNFRAVRRVLWITMGLNLIATVAKLAVGFSTNSLSLVADGFDSVFDSAANVIGLVGIYLASRPADADHPYGHRKAETITAMTISSLLFLTTWELLKSAVERLRDPSLIDAEVTALSFGALIVSIVIHVAVVIYEMREGRRLHSDVLVADAMHTRADIFISLSVMVGLVAVRLGYPLADPILALGVAILIAKIGIDIIRESSPVLMDQVAVPADELERIAMSVAGVVSCHQVRSRGHDGEIYADLHIQVDPILSTDQAHAIAHEVEYRLRESHPDVQDVTIHVEPAGSQPAGTLPDEKDWGFIAARLRRLADGLGLGVHDVWAYRVDDELLVDMHLEADGDLSLRQAHTQATLLEDRAHAEIPDLTELTTHIEPRGKVAAVVAASMGQSQVLDAVREIIRETLSDDACHHLQVRQLGKGWAILMHCQLPGDSSLADVHDRVTQLEIRLESAIPELERVVIHPEPLEV